MISTLLASVCFVSAFSAVRGDYSDGSYCSLLYRNNCKPSCSSGEQERRSVYQLCYIGKCCQPADSGSGSGSATWSNWSSWSACSATCGSGYQTRSRTCAGNNCPTASERATQSCTRQPCRAAVTPRVCGRDVLNARILGGRPTIECAHPWMVNFALYSIQQATPGVTGSLCGGVLISNNAVLTHTACVDKYFRPAWKLPSPGINIVVVVGDHKTGATDPNQRNRIVTEDLITGLGELTIVRLDPPVRYNSCVVPVCLPEATSSLSQQCTVAGWGETGSGTGWSDVLRDHPATLMSKESCETIFRYNYNENLPDGFLCTDSQRDKTSTCLGDEGGMLLCGDSTFGRTTLAGIANSTECDVNKPSTFMNIAPYMDKLVDYLDKN